MNRVLLGTFTALMLTGTATQAQYPEKEIQGIIQWGAGGSTDIVMRAITPHAEKVLGGKVVMQNMTGGVGAIATKFVISKPADGYTLLMGAENPQLYKIMGLAQQDYADFIPINVIARGIPILVARNDAPFNTLKEMVEHIRKKPGATKFGSTGPGGLPSVISAMLNKELDLNVTYVPYDGDGPALTALQGGAIDVMPAVLGAAIENIRAGRMKPLAVIDTAENAALPGVPAIVKDYPAFAKYLPWGPFFGIFVKNGTPEAAVKKLQAAYAAAAANPDFTALINRRGFLMINLPGEKARDFLNKWQSTTAWLLHDAKVAPFSPEKFGIPRPTK